MFNMRLYCFKNLWALFKFNFVTLYSSTLVMKLLTVLQSCFMPNVLMEATGYKGEG